MSTVIASPSVACGKEIAHTNKIFYAFDINWPGATSSRFSTSMTSCGSGSLNPPRSASSYRANSPSCVSDALSVVVALQEKWA
ncbi:hypothetical protein CsSME_00014490 [Camellia sinensis var. sinensis]